jgi:hypothetical protein
VHKPILYHAFVYLCTSFGRERVVSPTLVFVPVFLFSFVQRTKTSGDNIFLLIIFIECVKT